MAEAQPSTNDASALAIRPLVVGTEPMLGEYLSSLLVRACEANVFRKPAQLLDLAGLRVPASEFAPFTQATSAPDIAALLGTNIEAIERLMHPSVEDDFGRASVHWFGASIERRHIEATVRRFAPRSLQELQYYPAIWSVRLLDYCPRTMEILISDCPQCYRPLGWRACRSLSKCERCGASLLGAKSRTLPHYLHEQARLGAALVSPCSAVRQAALSSLPKPFSTWSSADALLALMTLGEAQISLEPPAGGVEVAGSAACIAAGISFASDWPESLSKFAKSSTTKSGSASTGIGLGSLGKLFERQAKQTPIRDLIRSTISTSLGEAVIPVKLNSGTLVQSACRSGMLTTAEATKTLGVCGKHLRRLEGLSATFLVRHKAKGGTVLYDKAAIERLASILALSERTSDCARRLGIPHYCVDAFLASGLIEPVNEVDALIVTGSSLIMQSSIASLRERVVEMSSPFVGGVTLREAMCRNGDPLDWVATFKMMLTGRVRLWIDAASEQPLSDALFVFAEGIQSGILRRSNGPGIDGIKICCATAAQIIGTTSQFISAAVRIGFLKGEIGKRDYNLPLEGVLAFQKDFILFEEFCDQLGESRRRIGVQLRDADYEPAASINSTRVWRRMDIAKFMQDRTQEPSTPI